LQATETLKLILGTGETLLGRLVHFDALKMKFREFRVRRDPQCPVCGEHPTIFEPIDYELFCAGAEAPPSKTPEEVPAMSVQELKRRMDAHEPITLIDVREPFEHELARISGAELIPLGELSARLNEIPRHARIVVHCHTGTRSANAVEFLREAGFDDAANLEGGIEAWSVEIDPTVPRY
jgi:adenylyltransferase/sulfurtransferase